MSLKAALRGTLLLGVAAICSAAALAVQLANPTALKNILAGNGRCDTFEKFTWGSTTFSGAGNLDETTVLLGQGLLVNPNVSYSGPILWRQGGACGKRYWAANSGGMTITYKASVRAMGVNFCIEPGFTGNLTAQITMANGAVVNVPVNFTAAQVPYFFGYEDGRCISSVKFIDNTGQAAVSIMDHCFGCPRNRWWCERFTPYAYNTSPDGLNGWYLAEGLANEKGNIQDNWCSPPKALNVFTTTDLMRNFRCISNGRYIISSMWWNPGNTNVQRTYIALMSGTSPFSFNGYIGADQTDCRVFPSPGQTVLTAPSSWPLTKPNRWANICIDLDLTNDRFSAFYDGQFMGTYRYRKGPGDVLQLAAINIYGGDLGATGWVDDIAVIPYCPRTYNLGIADNFLGGPDPSPISNQLSTLLGPTRTGFDAKDCVERPFGASFMNLPMGPCKNFKADLFMRMRSCATSGVSDQVFLGLQANNTFAYSGSLSTLAGTPWTTGVTRIFYWNLINTPSTGTSVLDTINSTGKLDVAARWFTQADWARLRLFNCCCWWKGYQWEVSGSTIFDDLVINDNNDLEANLPSGAKLIGDLGSASGFDLDFDVADVAVSGRSWTISAFGRVGTSENSLMASITQQGLGSTSRVVGNFSPIGSDSALVVLLNSTGGIISQGVRPTSNLFTVNSVNDIKRAMFRCEPDYDEWILSDFGTVTINLGGTNFPAVAAVKVRAISPTVPRGALAHLEVSQVNIPNWIIQCLQTYQGDLLYTQKGEGIQSGNGIGTTFAGFNELDTSGVEIDFPSSSGWKFYSFLTGDEEPAVGSALKINAYARKNGIPGSLVGSMEIMKNSTAWELWPDYSAVNSSTVNVLVFKNGELIANLKNLAPDSVTTTLFPRSCGKGFPGGPPCFFFDLNPAGLLKVGTTGYPGATCVRILAEPVGAMTVNDYSKVEITGIGIDELFVPKFMPLNLVTGKVTLQGLGVQGSKPVLVQIREQGSDVTMDAVYVTPASDGSVTVPVGLTGNVQLGISGSTWLRKNVLTSVSNSGTFSALTLLNGDCDGNNDVGTDDYLILNAAFDTSIGDDNYDERADLTCDGYVGTDDYILLNTNFDKSGDDW